jgi:zinc/manganese transport system substrate-binding protein
MLKTMLSLFVLLASAGVARADLKIVTTAPEFADMARRIGGNKVEAHSVMKGPENVHNVLAKPTEMLKLNQADLFVHSGLDTEPWRDNFMKGARNPKILTGQPGNVDMSAGIELKEVPAKADRSQGDMHAYGNPHFQLNIANAQKMAVTLAQAMIRADPANAEAYRQNAKALVTELGDTARAVKEKFKPYAGLKVVTFHRAWAYLPDTLDVNIVGTIEPKPGITPSAAQVRETVDMMKREGVKVVVVETYNDEKLARSVAEAAGARLIVLPDHVNGVAGVDTYPKLFQYITDKLIEAAKAGA